MAFFARRVGNGTDLQHGLPDPPPGEGELSFADKMFRSMTGLTLADVTQAAEQARAMLQSYDDKLGQIVTRLDLIESDLSELVEIMRDLQRRDAKPRR